MKFSTNIYDTFMAGVEARQLKTRRNRLLSGLKGRVLEVGVGTGVNFEHYNPEARVIGLEPAVHMMEQAELRRQGASHPHIIQLYALGWGDRKTKMFLESNVQQFDAIVCTLVLCTLPNPEQAIRDFHGLLKPGGRLVVLEHVRSNNGLARALQNLFTPLWSVIGGGCELNRPTGQTITEAGFVPMRETRFSLGLPFLEAEYGKLDAEC